jgi:hypothetical protein
MVSRSVRVRLLVLVTLVVAFVAAAASPAFALKVNWAKPSGPIAYDLKSLQKTYFQASVDTTNCYAVMKVKTGRGDVVIYKGAIPYANRTYTFPGWTGMGPDGKRLTTSNYPWELTISKGGNVATKTGRIPVTRIIWSVSNSAKDAQHTDSYSKYMLAGKANVYFSARRPVDAQLLGLFYGTIINTAVINQNGRTYNAQYGIPLALGGTWTDAGTMGGAQYLSSGSDLIYPTGTHTLRVTASAQYSYKLTFMQ